MIWLSLVLTLTIGFTLVLGQNQLATLMQAHAQCQSSSGITPNLVSGLMAGNFPNDPALKRHLLCINQRLGVQDSNGNVQVGNMIQMAQRMVPPANRAAAEQTIRNCAVNRGTPGDTALEMDRCLFQARSAIMG